jgi:hypothetical protein
MWSCSVDRCKSPGACNGHSGNSRLQAIAAVCCRLLCVFWPWSDAWAGPWSTSGRQDTGAPEQAHRRIRRTVSAHTQKRSSQNDRRWGPAPWRGRSTAPTRLCAPMPAADAAHGRMRSRESSSHATRRPAAAQQRGSRHVVLARMQQGPCRSKGLAQLNNGSTRRSRPVPLHDPPSPAYDHGRAGPHCSVQFRQGG